MQRPSIAALLLVLLGASLRFHALDNQSLWNDEMSSIRTMTLPASEALYRFRTYEAHPPLYFLQLKLWRSLGMRSLVRLRANSALWGTLSLFLVYLAARFYGGERSGLLALGFLALSPFHLAYSQELRPYAMAMALGLASLLALEHRTWWRLGFLWTTLLYTHYWGAFVILAQGTYGIYSAQSKRDIKSILTAASCAGFFFLPWIPVLQAQLGVIDTLSFWVPVFSFANLGKVFLAYSGLLFNMASWTFYLPTMVWVIGLIGLCFASVFLMGIVNDRKGPLFWLVVGIGVPWIISIWKPAIFVWYRYPVIMLPAFAILVAAGLVAIKSRPVRVILTLALMGSQAWGSWIYFHGWQKANPKAVMQYVHWLRQPESVIVRPSYFTDLFSFYDQATSKTVLDENLLDTPEKRAALKGKRIIVIAFDVPSDPVTEALLTEFKQQSARYFPGTAHLAVIVYELK